MNITAEEFDKIFDEGNEDILQYCDLDNIYHPNSQRQHITVDISDEIANLLDNKARILGISRQDILHNWIIEKSKELTQI